jgi:hypothetical protein
MNGTINATSRRDLLTQKGDIMAHTSIAEPVKVTPSPAPIPSVTHKPEPLPETRFIPNVTPNIDASIQIRDQYVKISTSLAHLNSVSNNLKKDVNTYKKLTDEQIGHLSNSQKQTSDELNAYKKLTDERIEKIANLFLSINK